jgi:hypothetical protein
MDPQKIKEALMVDEEALLAKMLTRIQAHLGLDKKGKVHIHSPHQYRQKDVIALYLIGARFAADAKLRENDTVALSEICENLAVDSKAAAARLAELRNEGKVESPSRGDSRIVFPRVASILNEIEANRPGGQ